MATTLEEVATLLQEFKSREAELRIKEQKEMLSGIGTTLYNMLDLVKEGYRMLDEKDEEATDKIRHRLHFELNTLDEQVAALWK